MKKILIFYVFIGSIAFSSDLELNNDDFFKISIEEGIFDSKYYINDDLISSGKLKESVFLFPESKSLYTRSKITYYSSLLFSISGSFLLGYEISGVILEQELDPTNLSISAGCFAIYYLLCYISNKDLNKAVNIYNGNLLNYKL